jgi:hypothetical protein
VWWLDEHTTRLLIDFIGLGDTITVSVDPGPPRVLPREQVRGDVMVLQDTLGATHRAGNATSLHAGR